MNNSRLLGLFFFVVLTIFGNCTLARNAGVLPFSMYQGKPVILLGLEPKIENKVMVERWTDFGGTANKGESSQQSATREFCEETMYVFKQENPAFASKATVLPLINKAPFTISNERVGYDIFFIQVPYIDASFFEKEWNHLLKQRGAQWLRQKGIEKSNYAWVEVKELLDSLMIAQKNPNPMQRSIGVKVNSIDGRPLILYKNLTESLLTPPGLEALNTLLFSGLAL